MQLGSPFAITVYPNFPNTHHKLFTAQRQTKALLNITHLKQTLQVYKTTSLVLSAKSLNICHTNCPQRQWGVPPNPDY